MRIASEHDGGDIHSVAAANVLLHHMRIGQAYSNAAHHIDPEWATAQTGSDIDPFYDDTRLGDYLVAWHKEH